MRSDFVPEESGGWEDKKPGAHLRCTRRQTLIWGGASIIGLSALGTSLARGTESPLIIMGQARGMIVADPVLCVGCGRCELACTEFNDGKAAPYLARIKIDRNMHFGPRGVAGWRNGNGNMGDGLIVQDLCRQCPHPVPCANICPEHAIVVSEPTGARVVDPERCTGCRICLQACPWEMISYDPESRKAVKCHLCAGKPECVEACPAGALSYVAWQDLTGKTTPRNLNTAVLPPSRLLSCRECHLPGSARNLKEFGALIRGIVGGRRSTTESGGGFKWIDAAGVIVVPLAIGSVLFHAVLRRVMRR